MNIARPKLSQVEPSPFKRWVGSSNLPGRTFTSRFPRDVFKMLVGVGLTGGVC